MDLHAVCWYTKDLVDLPYVDLIGWAMNLVDQALVGHDADHKNQSPIWLSVDLVDQPAVDLVNVPPVYLVDLVYISFLETGSRRSVRHRVA